MVGVPRLDAFGRLLTHDGAIKLFVKSNVPTGTVGPYRLLVFRSRSSGTGT